MCCPTAGETKDGLKNVKKRAFLWFYLALSAVTFFVYEPAWYGKPILDDIIHLPRPDDQSLVGLQKIWISPRLSQQYHPLVDSVFWVEARAFGSSMLEYHLVNIALHCVATGLLLLILRKVCVPGAWLAAAFFALHPVQVESVAFLSELKNTLSAVFLFGAVLAYLKFDESRRQRCYWLAVLLVIAGVFAKTTTAYLPVCVLILIWWIRGTIDWRRELLPLLPFFLLGILAAIGTGWMEREFSAAKGEGFEFSWTERVLIAGRAFWFYLAKIAWPADLMLIYPRWTIDPRAWWQYSYPAAATALIVSAWLARRRLRWLWAALLFFLCTLIPFIGFFNVRIFRFQFVSDHFQYLPLLAVSIPSAAGLSRLLGRWRGWKRIALAGAILALLAVWSTLTWRHSASFADSETCYRDVLAKNPEAWVAHSNLASVLLKTGRLGEAEAHLRRALQINPRDASGLSEIHINLGYVLMQQGHLEEALGLFQQSVALRPDFRAYNSIGSIQHRQGKRAEALQSYANALIVLPDMSVTLTNMAWILATAPDDSLRDGKRALQLALRANELSGGADPIYLHTLAACYAENGDFAHAIATAQHAIERAQAQSMKPLIEQLRSEISLYELGLPYREASN